MEKLTATKQSLEELSEHFLEGMITSKEFLHRTVGTLAIHWSKLPSYEEEAPDAFAVSLARLLLGRKPNG